MTGIMRRKLVFAAGHEGPEAVPIKDLKRVREPLSRSKSGLQGKVAGVLHGRSRQAESQNEIKAFRILAATARADTWQEQPFLLEYHLEQKRHRYTPDVMVAAMLPELASLRGLATAPYGRASHLARSACETEQLQDER